MFLTISLVIFLVVGLIVVARQTFFRTPAQTVIPDLFCGYEDGECALDTTGMKPGDIPNVTLMPQIQGNGSSWDDHLSPGVQNRNGSIISVKFPITNPNKALAYRCQVRLGGQSSCRNESSPGFLTSCPATTPIITTPTATPTSTPSPTTSQVCETCGKPGFSCGLPRNVLPGDSCPAKAVYDVTYKSPSLSCSNTNPAQYPTLSCDPTIHQVVIRPMPIGSGKDRLLDRDECNALQNGTFDLELSMGKRGLGCQTYKIVVLDPNTDAEIPSFEICDKCELQSGCPASCPATTEVNLDEAMIDVPELKGNGWECPANLCKLTVSEGACGMFGDTARFQIDGKSGMNSARIYLDDEYNGSTWIPVTISGGGSGTVTHKFENSGYYDVVAECNYGNQAYYCAQRITRMCSETTTPPSITPPACLFTIEPKLEFTCADCEPSVPLDPTADPR